MHFYYFLFLLVAVSVQARVPDSSLDKVGLGDLKKIPVDQGVGRKILALYSILNILEDVIVKSYDNPNPDYYQYKTKRQSGPEPITFPPQIDSAQPLLSRLNDLLHGLKK